MDPQIITALQKANSASQFTAAVDALPREQKYYTKQVRELLREKKRFIASSKTADSVISFLDSFSCHEDKRHLLQTPQIRDLIINVLAPTISGGDPVYHLGGTVCSIVRDKLSAELYSSAESFNAILSCFHRATTDDGAHYIASAINNIIVYNPSAQKLLNNLPVVEAFSALLPHATSDDTVKWVSNSLREVLRHNDEAQKMFGTPKFFEKFKTMKNRATSDDAKDAFKRVVDVLQPIVRAMNEKSLRNAKTSQELVSALDSLTKQSEFWPFHIDLLLREKKRFIVGSKTADSVISFLNSFSCHEDKRPCLRTPQIRDLIINVLAPTISGGDPVYDVGGTVCSIAQDKLSAELYSNPESFTAILSCFHRVTTAQGAQWIAGSIYNTLFFTPWANKLLNNLPVVEAFSALLPHATSGDAVQWISKSLQAILNNNIEARKMFGTPSFFEKFKTMEKHATSHAAKASLKLVVDELQLIILWSSTETPIIKVMEVKIITALQKANSASQLKAAVDALPREQQYYTEQTRDLVLQKKKLITDSPAADSIASFLRSFALFEDKQHLLRTREIRDLAINVLAPKINGGAPVFYLGSALCNIVEDKPSSELYTTPESFKAILSCFHRATTADSAYLIAGSIYNILLYNPSANKLLNDLPAVEAFSALFPHATSDEAVKWISIALQKILLDNNETKKMFGTPTFFELFKTMEKCASSEDAKASLKLVVDELQLIILWSSMETPIIKVMEVKIIAALQKANSASQLKAAVDALPREQQFYTEQTRDLVLQQKKLITDSPTADSVVSFLNSFSSRKDKRPYLRTSEIRDLIINDLAPKISGGDPVDHLGRVVCNIVQDKPSSELYSTPESFKVILSCFHQATAAGSARWIASSIINILLFNPSTNKLLKDLPVVEAFSALLPHATSDDAVKWISIALQKILLDNNEAKKMFGTPTFFEKFSTMEKHATSEDAKASFKRIVDKLQSIVNSRAAIEMPLREATTSQELITTLDSIPNQSEFCSSLIDVLLTKKHLIQNEESTTATAKFVKWCCETNEKLIQQKEIYDLFENVLFPNALKFVKSIPQVHEALAFLIVKNNKEAQEFFSSDSFKVHVMASLPHADECLLKILDSLLVGNKKPQQIFGTPDVKKNLEFKFVSNNSREFTNVIEVLNERIIHVRFDALKKLAADHNEQIDEECLNKLAVYESDVADLLDVDVSSLVIQLQLTIKQNASFSRLIQKMKNKNNGVPLHQDPFKLQELEQLRQEHNDLRKLHQDLVTSTSKSIDDLNNLLQNEKKQHASTIADRDAKSKKNNDQEKKIDVLEKDLQKSSGLKKSLDDAKTQLQTSLQQNASLQSQLDAISPFVRDKLYQIDSNVNDLPQAQDVITRHTVAPTARIFAEAQKLMTTSGALIHDPASPNEFKFSPVKGFTLKSVDVILRGAAGFEDRLKKIQGFRLGVTDRFNPAFAAFSPEQQKVLKILFAHFLPRPPTASAKFPNLVNVFHGTRVDCLDVAMDGLRAMRSTDDGYFGVGCYATTSIEYAAQYAKGDFITKGPLPVPRADGCYPVLWCVAAIGVCHPVSRADDYSQNRVHQTIGRVSNFFGSPLNKDCDCHCAVVGGGQGYQAVPPEDMHHMEIVVDQEAQVIPIAVLWVK